MATSSCRCSTPTTTRAASRPSTSIMWKAASRWRSSCARARRRPGLRSAPSSSIRSAASAGTGPTPGSSSGETPTTAARKPWPGARTMASTTSSASRAIARCIPSHTTWPTISRCAGPRPAPTGCAASPTSPTPRPLLEPQTPGRRPAGGDHARLRCPLHRHLAQGRGPPSLRRRLLRPRPGGEPDQAAQGSARLGSNLLPKPARQPAQAGPAHRRLLADARPARCHPPRRATRQCRVRHTQAAPAQDRRPRRRKAARIRIHFTSACPDAALFRLLAGRLAAAGP